MDNQVSIPEQSPKAGNKFMLVAVLATVTLVSLGTASYYMYKAVAENARVDNPKIVVDTKKETKYFNSLTFLVNQYISNEKSNDFKVTIDGTYKITSQSKASFIENDLVKYNNGSFKNNDKVVYYTKPNDASKVYVETRGSNDSKLLHTAPKGLSIGLLGITKDGKLIFSERKMATAMDEGTSKVKIELYSTNQSGTIKKITDKTITDYPYLELAGETSDGKYLVIFTKTTAGTTATRIYNTSTKKMSMLQNEGAGINPSIGAGYLDMNPEFIQDLGAIMYKKSYIDNKKVITKVELKKYDIESGKSSVITTVKSSDFKDLNWGTLRYANTVGNTVNVLVYQSPTVQTGNDSATKDSVGYLLKVSKVTGEIESKIEIPEYDNYELSIYQFTRFNGRLFVAMHTVGDKVTIGDFTNLASPIMHTVQVPGLVAGEQNSFQILSVE